jgi:hypothetical protein
MAKWKEQLAKPYAWWVHQRNLQWKLRAAEVQQEWLLKLCHKAAHTQFGIDHHLKEVRTAKDFADAVPIRDYEMLRSYVDVMVDGKPDVLWPGRPLYYAKTSGTTSGAKYIPISKESMPFHIESAKEALLEYAFHSGNYDYIGGKMIFLQGSPEMTDTHGVKTGRLSGIVAHYVPAYLQANRLPSWETNCIDDWETKLAAIVQETKTQDMRLISGIPPWVQMYFEHLIKATGVDFVSELFPKFSLFVTGGVNYEPYRATIDQLVGRSVDMLETYPASEGFIAYNDFSGEEGLLLLANHGIYYEFVPLEEVHEERPTRLSLAEVQKGQRYAILLTTNAGLWSYLIGDTIEFVSLRPYRIKVTGRIAHYISAFGEHVIGSEVEWAMEKACSVTGCRVLEFTVAPQVNPAEGAPYHEWFVAFDQEPEDLEVFMHVLDMALREKNTYYNDLIKGKILRECVVHHVARDLFANYMKSIGKLGGQNKLPRLSNDRKMADVLLQMMTAH